MRKRRFAMGPVLAALVVALSILPSAGDGRPADKPPIPEPPSSIPTPPPLPNGAKGPPPITEAIPQAGNRVRALPPEASRTLEANAMTIVENEDGLVVVETTDDSGGRVRIAALNEQTDLGTDVIGLAFLDEADIVQLEEMESNHEAGLFGPVAAQAHYQGQSHYHYFYQCSWVYNQGGTYGISWYMCPNDTFWDRKLGQALTLALSVATKTPLLMWLGGMLTANIEDLFYNGDGSLRGSVSDFRAACGWVLWNNLANHWMYYYCAGSANYGYGWDDLYDTFFYVRYP